MKEKLKKVRELQLKNAKRISKDELKFITGGAAVQALGSTGTTSDAEYTCDGTAVHCCHPPLTTNK